MGKEIKNNLGKINISEEVIATIAGGAALECQGLVGMASRKIKDGFADLLRRENLARGVVVTIEENEASIDLYIIVCYGINISETAAAVMDRVRRAIEKYTGFSVNKVNVYVQGVRILEKEEKPDKIEKAALTQ
ncbi:MAG TPA: Asp23/Gls24 family envelope stress response protein [Desulfitobacteriaceae bacterium]|nr:Asp23/Gls24 family envelope stress response protein [Desulfitobacteriaceae bacterium]